MTGSTWTSCRVSESAQGASFVLPSPCFRPRHVHTDTRIPVEREELSRSLRTEATEADVHRKIRKAFQAFDYEADNTVDVREIGTIIYSLGCFPSQKDLHDFIAEVEEDHTGYIHLDKFLPAMTKVLLEKKFLPIPENRLLQAFKVLDKGTKGYLETEEMTKYMTQEGEPLTQEEVEEMLTALADTEKNHIYYKDVISQLTIDPDI
nr:PREDICTED: EF-hand calcium-binding domain-containing protein 2 isoform X1 [Paralichthys olivaceus]